MDSPHCDVADWPHRKTFFCVSTVPTKRYPHIHVRWFLNSQRGSSLAPRSTLVSMCLILMLIFLFVPWQVAFLGCWVIHLDTCANYRSTPALVEPAIPLIPRPQQESDSRLLTQPEVVVSSANAPCSPTDVQSFNLSTHHRNMHLLLLMTWLLPLVAPVLAVWVRTLMTAGFTVPFNGDHNFLHVAPFLLLVDARSSGRIPEIREG